MSRKKKLPYREQIKEKSPLVCNFDWNTFIIFNKLKFSELTTTVYIACCKIRNNITISRVKAIVDLLEKRNVSKKSIKRCLIKLCNKKFLTYGFDENEYFYYVANTTKINKLYKKLLVKNFYDSWFYIDEYTLKYFLYNSKEKNIHNFLCSELISRLWYMLPVTYDTIQKYTGITKNKVQKLRDLKSKEFKIKTKNEYGRKVNVIIGKIYYQDYNAVHTKINKFLKEKYYYNEKNELNENNQLRKKKIPESCPTLSSSAFKARWLGARYAPWFSAFKTKHIEKLAEKTTIISFKKNKKIKIN
ncbi:MAG: hypothetical protein QXG00_07050 [Candidatus Woesearchaeota archaeon]